MNALGSSVLAPTRPIVAPAALASRSPITQAAATPESAGPQDSFTPSSPQVTGSWLSNQLKNAKPGAMFVLDDFQPTGGQAIPGLFAMPEWMASHGGQVVSTAKQEGFGGQTVPLEINRPLSDAQRNQTYGELTRLWNDPNSTPEQLQQSIGDRAVVNRTRLLDNASTSLNDLTAAGAHDSVTNISASGSQAATANNILRRMLPTDRNDPASVAYARGERAKFAKAFGVDDNDLNSDDENVWGPARQKMFQGVFNLVGATQTDPRFVQSKADYDSAVNAFEANNNSVVVASGNDAPVAPFWERAANGAPLQLPAGFTHNDLGAPAATVVGAAVANESGQQVPAPYNNPDRIDVFANGYAGSTAPKDEQGSSFGAPRVAAAMAGLHGRFPGLSSSQAENLMRQRFTGSFAGTDGVAVSPVLDIQSTSSFLQSGTF